MIGIDLGITVSSITLTNPKNEIIDTYIIFGDTKNKDHWSRVIDMTEFLVNAVHEMIRNTKVVVAPLAAIEQPVFPYRTRNPQSYFNMCCLYALLRNKLSVRGFSIYSVHPLGAKAIAKRMLKGKVLKTKFFKSGSLNKNGMVAAFKIVIGKLPDYHTKVGRETLADSFFIAQAGIEKRRIELGIKRN